MHELKKTPLSRIKKFSLAESFTLCPEKPLVFATKTPLIRTTFTVLKNRLFMCKKPFIRTNLSLLPSKTILFCPPLPLPTALNYCPQKNSIFTNQKLSFAQTFPYCYPKLLFSTLRLPFAPPLTYCLRRIQLFFFCSL